MAETADSTEVVPAKPMLLTFLIADVRGYTSFTEERGDEAAGRLASRFADLCEQAVAARDGKVLELRGDEILAAFPSARQALHCAVAMQRRFTEEASDEIPLRVGVGLDAGEAIPVRGGYRGGALNLAARLCSLAGPGEVFASEGLIHLARKTEGLRYVDRGQVQLKGLADPIRVFQIGVEGEVAKDLPPLEQILVAHPSNLPDDPTLFVGREREIAEVSALLRRPKVRLVTLTGPGGTGKTRLALHIGGALLYEFKDGVFFASLAPLTDPSLVLSAIAQVFGVMEAGEQPLIEILRGYLEDKQLLLVLDNFEHLLDARSLLPELLESCRQLKILITSRSLLRLSWEHVFEVPTLSSPNPRTLSGRGLHDAKLLSQYEAVALFLERAQAAKANFSITNENAPAVAEICYRLDGLPLAIELAAARIRLFPPQALLGRLSSRLKLLTGGAKDAPNRQQTMRGAIDWSYSVLNETEQALFGRLSVFAGGCSLEAVEALCDSPEVLDGLESLVEKSLLRQEGNTEARFSMLETIREYASERLDDRGEADALKRAHAEYFLELAEEAQPELRGAEQGRWLDRLETEHDNLRAALEWANQRREFEMGLCLAGSIWRFWMVRGHLTEGRRWLEDFLARDGTPSPARAQALNAAGNLAWFQTDFDKAVTCLEESLALRQQFGDDVGVAMALGNLGAVALQREDYRESQRLYEESVTILRKTDDSWSLGIALSNLGLAMSKLKDYGQARELGQESMALLQEIGDKHGMARVLDNLASTALEQGDHQRAKALQVEGLLLTREIANSENIPTCLEGLAKVAAVEGDGIRAARLWGASEILRQRLREPLSPDEQSSHDRYVAIAQSRVSRDEFFGEWQAGRSMPPEDAVEYGLAEPAGQVAKTS